MPSARTMKSRHTRAGMPPPDRPGLGELSSLPIHTAGDQIAGIADEPGVAIVLRGAGLTEGRDRQRRAAPGARSHHRSQQRAHVVELAAAEAGRRSQPRRQPVVGGFGIVEPARAHRIAPVRHRGIGGGQLEQRHGRGAQSRSRRRWRSASRCRDRARRGSPWPRRSRWSAARRRRCSIWRRPGAA